MSVISSMGSWLSPPIYSAKTSTHNNAIIPPDSTTAGVQKIFEQIEQDPLFAKEMVQVYTFVPDRAIYDANDVPSNLEDWKVFQDRTNQFSQIAENVTAKRIDIYNKMKAENASDADIFKSLMEFNKSLPMDYQLKTGLSRYSMYV